MPVKHKIKALNITSMTRWETCTTDACIRSKMHSLLQAIPDLQNQDKSIVQATRVLLDLYIFHTAHNLFLFCSGVSKSYCIHTTWLTGGRGHTHCKILSSDFTPSFLFFSGWSLSSSFSLSWKRFSLSSLMLHCGASSSWWFTLICPPVSWELEVFQSPSLKSVTTLHTGNIKEVFTRCDCWSLITPQICLRSGPFVCHLQHLAVMWKSGLKAMLQVRQNFSCLISARYKT